MKNKLIQKNLFGNEAGEDELPEVLKRYFVQKDEFTDFYDQENRFLTIRSKKGMGKSSLLKMIQFSQEENENCYISLFLSGTGIEPFCNFEEKNSNKYINVWQQAICNRINFELSRDIGLTLDQDKLDIINNSEILGFKRRNLLDSLISRYEIKYGGNSIKKNENVKSNSFQMLKRIAKKEKKYIWVFIDDIDATFINDEKNRLKISSFYSACRLLSTEIDGLILRVSSRTDVWTLIKQHDEALDKCEQYMVDLKWEKKEFKTLIRKKIYSFHQSVLPDDKDFNRLDINKDKDGIEILKLVFKGSFLINEKGLRKIEKLGAPPKVIKKLSTFKEKKFDSYNLLNHGVKQKLTDIEYEKFGKLALEGYHSHPLLVLNNKIRLLENSLFQLSNKRPRWAVQLCKLAALKANKRKVRRIASKDINDALPEFSKMRLDDLYREHRHQFLEIADLIGCFSFKASRYYTMSLVKFIKETYLKYHDIPEIDGKKVNNTMEIIDFLFRIDFIQQVLIDQENKKKPLNKIVYYDENPNVISNISYQKDKDFCWRIHQSYLSALKIKNMKIQ